MIALWGRGTFGSFNPAFLKLSTKLFALPPAARIVKLDLRPSLGLRIKSPRTGRAQDSPGESMLRRGVNTPNPANDWLRATYFGGFRVADTEDVVLLI